MLKRFLWCSLVLVLAGQEVNEGSKLVSPRLGLRKTLPNFTQALGQFQTAYHKGASVTDVSGLTDQLRALVRALGKDSPEPDGPLFTLPLYRAGSTFRLPPNNEPTREALIRFWDRSESLATSPPRDRKELVASLLQELALVYTRTGCEQAFVEYESTDKREGLSALRAVQKLNVSLATVVDPALRIAETRDLRPSEAPPRPGFSATQSAATRLFTEIANEIDKARFRLRRGEWEATDALLAAVRAYRIGLESIAGIEDIQF